jgi:hypothetical protein
MHPARRVRPCAGARHRGHSRLARTYSSAPEGVRVMSSGPAGRPAVLTTPRNVHGCTLMSTWQVGGGRSRDARSQVVGLANRRVVGTLASAAPMVSKWRLAVPPLGRGRLRSTSALAPQRGRRRWRRRRCCCGSTMPARSTPARATSGWRDPGRARQTPLRGIKAEGTCEHSGQAKQASPAAPARPAVKASRGRSRRSGRAPRNLQ